MSKEDRTNYWNLVVIVPPGAKWTLTFKKDNEEKARDVIDRWTNYKDGSDIIVVEDDFGNVCAAKVHQISTMFLENSHMAADTHINNKLAEFRVSKLLEHSGRAYQAQMEQLFPVTPQLHARA